MSNKMEKCFRYIMNSEGEDFPSNKQKRYKMILDPNCDPALQLSQNTIKIWSEASEKIINQMKLRRK